MLTVLHSPNTKKVLAVVVVVVVVLTGIPILVGGSGMAACPECDVHAFSTSGCSAVLFGVSLFVAMAAWLLRPAPHRRYRHGFAWALDPPPRLV